MRTARVGCSGWMYDDWRGAVYPRGEPKGRWLELYAARFDTVEVNATVYRLPRRETVAAWARQTPDGFVFSVKASRYITHVKRLSGAREAIARFCAVLEPLREARRLGPILWQRPENFHRDDERLHAWLAELPAGLHTIEFRHSSWFVPEVMAALRPRGVALTIGDHPQRQFQTCAATAPWRFIRFHYGSRGRKGNYSATEIAEWAARINAWRRNCDVYAYFNNDWRGYAPANARALTTRLGGSARSAGRRAPPARR